MSSILKPLYGSAISGRENGLLTGFEFDVQESVIINKEVTGLAGGADGNVIAGVQTSDSIMGRGFRFLNNNGVIFSSQSGTTIMGGTIIFTARLWDTIAADRYLLLPSPLLLTSYHILVNNGDLITRFGDVADQDSGFDYTEGKAFRVAVTWSSSHVWVYIDGNLVDDYDATFATNLGPFGIGGLGIFPPTTTIEHDQYEWKLYCCQLSAAEVRADYIEYAKRVQFYDKLLGLEVTPTSQTVGFLGGSPWEISGGQWDIVDALLPVDRFAKAYRATVAGILWLRRQSVNVLEEELLYGRHGFWFLSGGTSATFVLGDTISPFAATGYYMDIGLAGGIQVVEITAGAPTAIFSSAGGEVPPNTWVYLELDRREDGQFSVYKDGILVPPTGIYTNPFTDTTHRLGDFVSAFLGTGNQFTHYSKTFGHLSL